jgi:hypothetical protein
MTKIKYYDNSLTIRIASMCVYEPTFARQNENGYWD